MEWHDKALEKTAPTFEEASLKAVEASFDLEARYGSQKYRQRLLLGQLNLFVYVVSTIKFKRTCKHATYMKLGSICSFRLLPTWSRGQW